MGLLNRAGAADNCRKSKLLKQASLGAVRNRMCGVIASGLQCHELGRPLRLRQQTRHFIGHHRGKPAIWRNGFHFWLKPQAEGFHSFGN